MNEIIYKRNCPNCNKELSTKNKYFFKKCVKRNSTCLACSLTGKKKSEKHKDNLSKNHADFSGEKNPFYGKTHNEQTRNKCGTQNVGKDRFTKKQKMEKSLAMRGEKNHFYKKTHTAETLLILAAPKTVEHKIKLSLANKGKKSPRKNVHVTDETRRKMRISAIKRLKRTFGENVFRPNVNPSETMYFAELEARMGWDGMYFGKNGQRTQYLLEDLGYYVDFYDGANNVVVEYDETKHYDKNWNLHASDVRRQNEIKAYLKCKFFRYNAAKNHFYEV